MMINAVGQPRPGTEDSNKGNSSSKKREPPNSAGRDPAVGGQLLERVDFRSVAAVLFPQADVRSFSQVLGKIAAVVAEDPEGRMSDLLALQESFLASAAEIFSDVEVTQQRRNSVRDNARTGSKQDSVEDILPQKKRSWREKVADAATHFRELPVVPTQKEGSVRNRTFLLLEDSSKSSCGKINIFIELMAIFVSTVSFMMESMPTFKSRPPECADLLERGLPLTVEACEPRPHEAFFLVEAVCIAIFTYNYFLRLCMVHSFAKGSTVSAGLGHTWKYFLQPMNIVDFLAILPFYIQLAVGGRGLGIIRVLRLMRICRVFKLARHHPGVELFKDVLVMSGLPLFVLVFLDIIVMLVFGAIIFNVEGQRYSVDEKLLSSIHPTGAYVRDVFPTGDEATPFRSIPYAFWWVCVTCTTVGYGDIYPTTPFGKVVGVACFYVGVIFLALPISVLGGNFDIVYSMRYPPKQLPTTRTSTVVVGEPLVSMTFAEMPWFPVGGSIRRRIFVLFDNPSLSKLGKLLSILLMAMILVVSVTFVLVSMPSCLSTPAACGRNGPLTVEDCEPVPAPEFAVIELVAIVTFTLDYVFRVLTVHAVSSEELGLPTTLRHISGLRKTFIYVTQPLNIIDFLAIFPYYLEAINALNSAGVSAVLRVLRLIRIFRVMKMRILNMCVTMFANILKDSIEALSLTIFMTLMLGVLSGSCILFAEGSAYSVSSETLESHPMGAYMRPSVEGYTTEESPFRSIPGSLWWYFTTATTVGYGDIAPTTTVGRVIGMLTFYVGIVLLALPISVVGGYFNQHYKVWLEDVATEKQDDIASFETFPAHDSMEAQGEESRKLYDEVNDNLPMLRKESLEGSSTHPPPPASVRTIGAPPNDREGLPFDENASEGRSVLPCSVSEDAGDTP
eukprot:TRINITY_DN2169_c0_g1_i1.p1 TRINITY_DN2169_c0_g1~~TRINITY_DN2169_c0_g1_i1.p1  ORF type:complete len:902 (+),score=132.97 TRINITY_DN2169_c0_g1_i1:113-2818(+)